MRKLEYIDQIRVAKEIIHRLETKQERFFMQDEDVLTLKATRAYLQMLLGARA